MEDKIELRWLKKRHTHHFTVIDDIYIVEEDRHNILSRKRSGIIRYSTGTAKKLNEEFNKLWEQACRFDVKEKISIIEKAIKEDRYKPSLDTKELEEIEIAEWGKNVGFVKLEDDNPTTVTIKDIYELKEKLKITNA